MKSWPLAASVLVALCFPATAASPAEPVNIGRMIDFMHAKLAERCQATP